MSLMKEFNGLPIGKKIRQVLLLKGVSASDLAEEFGMTRQGMAYKLDNDAWNIPEIQKLATILKIDPKDFFEGK